MPNRWIGLRPSPKMREPLVAMNRDAKGFCGPQNNLFRCSNYLLQESCNERIDHSISPCGHRSRQL